MMSRRTNISKLVGLVSCIYTGLAYVVMARAFLVGPARQTTRTSSSSLLMVQRGGGTGEDKNPLNTGELTTALARLDRQWKIQQRAKGPKSRWTKLILPNDQDKSSRDTADEVIEKDPFVETPFQDYVYLLEPESSIPSCLIVFVGGAGLGQFPQIAYSEFLMRVSNRLNAAIIAAPYQVGLNHFDIAKQTGERLRKALIHCEDDPSRQYPSSLPTYCLAHSLGAKLQTIYMAATGQDYDGVGYLSYNNFSFSQTIAMAKTFAQQLRRGGAAPSGVVNNDALSSIFDLAETAVGALGFDFSPSPPDMDRLIQLKYTPELQTKTRLFVFDEDTLDSSKSFAENCLDNDDKLSISGLPGNHLTPVYFKLGLDDIPEEARSMAVDAMGGIESASFGNEDDLDALVDEVCSWILGKQPTRGPNWDSTSRREEQGRLSPGEVTDSRQ